MLGGNILPFGQGGMTTSQAKASPLTLVVALANATSVNTTDRLQWEVLSIAGKPCLASARTP